MWRYKIIEMPRAEDQKRDETLWELGRAGWELVHVMEGTAADAADRGTLTYYFKRPAGEDIGV